MDEPSNPLSRSRNLLLLFAHLILFLSARGTAHAYWPPLQDVQLTVDRSSVRWQVFDPKAGTWKSSLSGTLGAIISSGVTNGIVAYVERTSGLGEAIHWTVYDPYLQQWRSTWSGWEGAIVGWAVKDGVVGYVHRTIGLGEAVRWAIYDPQLQQWRRSWSGWKGAILGWAVQDGVVAYVHRASGLGEAVEFLIYDPKAQQWRSNSSGWKAKISSLSISNATVTYIADGQTVTSGYDPSRSGWYSGSTKPLAYFWAGPRSGPSPLWVWFTDMSIAAKSWSWDFGSGGSSIQRSPPYTFAGVGVFDVKLTVTGPGGSNSATTNIVTDLVAPTGSIRINGDANCTSTHLVNLVLSASDNSGIVAKMRLSNTGTTWTAWEPFAPNKSWSLADTLADRAHGIKTAYAQFQDAAGNISAAVSDTIRLNRIAAFGSVTINAGAASTSSSAVILSLYDGNDGHGCNVTQMRLSNDQSAWSPWEKFVSSKNWNLASGEGERTVFVQYADADGNMSKIYSDSINVSSSAPPATPTNVSPADGATDQILTVTLMSSAFSDPDGDAHAASQWRIINSSGAEVIVDTGEISPGNSGYTLESGKLAHATTYQWRVRYKDSSGLWSEYSSPTSFTTAPAPCQPPVITNQSKTGGDTVIERGKSLTLSIQADGTEPFSYEWQMNGVVVPGASTGTLVLQDAQPENSGVYQCLVRNACGTASSEPVQLTVLSAPPINPDPSKGAGQLFGIVAEDSRFILLQIDARDGKQTIVSSFSGGMLDSFQGIELDESTWAMGPDGTVVVAALYWSLQNLEREIGAIFRIHPVTGQQTLLVSGETWGHPEQLVIAPGGDIFTILETDGKTSLIRLSKETGVHSVVSSGGLWDGSQSGKALGHDLAMASDGQIVVAGEYYDEVLDREFGVIFRIHSDHGEQTVLASGDFLSRDVSEQIVVGSDGVVYFTWSEESPTHLIRVDPRDGSQSIVSSGGFLDGFAGGESGSRILVAAPDNNILAGGRYFNPDTDESFSALFQINTKTGEQTLISSGDWLSQARLKALTVDVQQIKLPPKPRAWITRSLGGAEQGRSLYDVAFGQGIFVTAGEYFQKYFTSADGIDWTERALPNFTILPRAISYGGNTFVSAGSGLESSPDGLNWSVLLSGPRTPYFADITYADGHFVAVGAQPIGMFNPPPPSGRYIERSSQRDGRLEWETTFNEAGVSLSAVTHGHGRFMAMGERGVVLSSSNALTWSESFTSISNRIHSLGFGNDVFVAVGEHGAIWTSPDGLDWKSRSSGTTHDLNAIAFAEGIFLVVGAAGTILASADGIEWKSENSGTTNALRGVTYGLGAFLAVGDAGTIVQSAQPVGSVPRFLIEPMDTISTVGGKVIFSAAVIGYPTPKYQWQLDGRDIAGATNSWLTLSNLAPHQAGRYRVIASNSAGSTLSSAAELALGRGDRWRNAAPVPARLTRPAAGFLNGMLYVFDPSGIHLYDPVTDQWKTKLDAEGISSAAELGGVIEGRFFFANGPPQAAVPGYISIYDPQVDAWRFRELGPLSDSHVEMGASAAVQDDRLYLIGGFLPDQGILHRYNFPLGTLQLYEPMTDSWFPKAPLPTARYAGMCALVAGRLYVAGGIGVASHVDSSGLFNTVLDILEAYDPVNNSWEKRAPLPGPLRKGSAVAVVADERLHVVSSGRHDLYDPFSDVWSTLAPFPGDGTELAAAQHEGRIYVVSGGGTNGTSPLWIYEPINRALTIIEQPGSQNVTIGESAVFSVTATGIPLPKFQWQFDGKDIIGATNRLLSLTNVQASHSGSYRVVASNALEVVISAGAILTATERELISIEIVSNARSLTIGETVQLVAELEYSDGGPHQGEPVVWSSSNPTIIAIDDQGRATALSSGTAVITAASGMVNDAGGALTSPGLRASLEIRVTAAAVLEAVVSTVFKGVRIQGAAGAGYVIEAINNLASDSWIELDTVVIESSPQVWLDPASPNLPTRFYRLRIR